MKIRLSRLGGTDEYLTVEDGDLNFSIFDGDSIRLYLELLTNVQLAELANYIQGFSLKGATPQFIRYLRKPEEEIKKRTGLTAEAYVDWIYGPVKKLQNLAGGMTAKLNFGKENKDGN